MNNKHVIAIQMNSKDYQRFKKVSDIELIRPTTLARQLIAKHTNEVLKGVDHADKNNQA